MKVGGSKQKPYGEGDTKPWFCITHGFTDDHEKRRICILQKRSKLIKKSGASLSETPLSVGLPGFEPGKSGPESEVLPLHHSPITFNCGAKIQIILYPKIFSIIFLTKPLYWGFYACSMFPKKNKKTTVFSQCFPGYDKTTYICRLYVEQSKNIETYLLVLTYDM